LSHLDGELGRELQGHEPIVARPCADCGEAAEGAEPAWTVAERHGASLGEFRLNTPWDTACIGSRSLSHGRPPDRDRRRNRRTHKFRIPASPAAWTGRHTDRAR